MTHRERVLAALSLKEPDRVPMDLASTRDSSLVVEEYEKLAAHFGVGEQADLLSRMMRVVRVEESILEALDIDTRGVFPASPADVETGPGRYRDEWGVERVRRAGMLYHDQESYPLSGSISRRDIMEYPWPNPTDPVRRRGLKEEVRRIRRSGDYAIVLNLPSAFVHVTQYLRGFEDWFVDIAADRRLFELLADCVLEVNLAACAEILDEVGGEVDVAMCSDDLGLQNGLMVSPECYRQVIKPRHQKYFDLVHEESPAKVFFHTCGAVGDIIEDLIEIGVDVLHPVQVSAAGMDPETLKKRFGGRLAFWGAVDTQRILPHGSASDVRAEVSRLIEVLGRGGGYVLGAVHNVQPDVPVANLLALFEQGRDYRRG